MSICTIPTTARATSYLIQCFESVTPHLHPKFWFLLKQWSDILESVVSFLFFRGYLTYLFPYEFALCSR